MDEELTYFNGIGKILANKLIDQMLDKRLIDRSYVEHSHTPAELARLLKNPAIFEHLPEATKCDLTYEPLRVVPRELIAAVDKEFHRLIKQHFDIGGSYIRGKSTSGDIDMVLETPGSDATTWADFMNTVNDRSKFLEILPPYAAGSDKVNTLLKITIADKLLAELQPKFAFLKSVVYVQMDVFLSTKEDYMYAMLFAIGSGLFNVRMRAVAKKRGMLLNNHGLFRLKGEKKEKIPLKTEEDIFRALGMTYRTPAERKK